MKHVEHPHGERVVQVHQLNDHLAPKKAGIAKLPDAKRETHMKEQPYPNDFNPEPSTGVKVDS